MNNHHNPPSVLNNEVTRTLEIRRLIAELRLQAAKVAGTSTNLAQIRLAVRHFFTFTMTKSIQYVQTNPELAQEILERALIFHQLCLAHIAASGEYTRWWKEDMDALLGVSEEPKEEEEDDEPFS